MTAISVPWIDPLRLLEQTMRLGLYSASRSTMQVVARIAEHRGPLVLGAPRAEWLSQLSLANPTLDIDACTLNGIPIVSAAIDVDDRDTLYWRPITLVELPAWLAQIEHSAYGLDSASPLNTKAMRAIARAVRGAGGSSEARTPMRKRIFSRVIRETSYPRHAGLASGLATDVEQPPFTPQQLAYALGWNGPEFAAPFVVDGARTRVGYVDLDCEERTGWRRQQHHGFKPDPQFFGKRGVSARTPNDALFAGVELEMELPDEASRARMMQALFLTTDALSGLGEDERLHVEHDGSLANHGIEVVLRPHEVGSAHGETFWRSIWRAACETGASNSEDSAGMHIHVNAAYALKPPPRGLSEADAWPSATLSQRPARDVQSTIGFCIDLITNILVGGPSLFALQPSMTPPNQSGRASLARRTLDTFTEVEIDANGRAVERAQPQRWPVVTQGYAFTTVVIDTDKPRFFEAFGRSRSYNAGFCKPHWNLVRKMTLQQGFDRYCAVNWQNEQTIEFRLFGPSDFDCGWNDDWINTATQMVGAIVAFSQSIAGRMLLVPNAPGFEAWMNECVPTWMQPFLDVTDITSIGSTMMSRLASTHNGKRFAAQSTVTGWLPGCAGDRQRRDEVEYLPHFSHKIDVLSAPRAATFYAATTLLWRAFARWLDDQSPRFDLARDHVAKMVLAHLPSDEVLRSVLAVPAPTITPRQEPLPDTVYPSYPIEIPRRTFRDFASGFSAFPNPTIISTT